VGSSDFFFFFLKLEVHQKEQPNKISTS